MWLHDRYLENDDYAGILVCSIVLLYCCWVGVDVTAISQIPPSPPRPNFDESREKLAKLGQAEGTMTKSEFQKMKVELEA